MNTGYQQTSSCGQCPRNPLGKLCKGFFNRDDTPTRRARIDAHRSRDVLEDERPVMRNV